MKLPRLKPQVQKGLIRLGYLLGGLGLLGAVGQRQDSRVCRHIEVEIEQQYGNYFIDEADIIRLITQDNRLPLIGSRQGQFSLKELEKRLLTNHFVRKCQVARSLNGDLLVYIQQARPIVRVLSPSGFNGYVGETGQQLPLSDRFTARVLLVEWEDERPLRQHNWLETEANKPYLQVFQYIDQSRFWKAQIAQLYIRRDGSIVLYPQIGKQYIEFGIPESQEDIADKFHRLDLFYKKIIPARGWNRYGRVSVAYENQIICE
jgi:cell division protein FtsQ